MQIRVLHNDDADITVRLHDSFLNLNTKLTKEQIIDRVQIFARILFNTILSDKREFTLVQNEETEEWEYLIPTPGQRD